MPSAPGVSERTGGFQKLAEEGVQPPSLHWRRTALPGREQSLAFAHQQGASAIGDLPPVYAVRPSGVLLPRIGRESVLSQLRRAGQRVADLHADPLRVLSLEAPWRARTPLTIDSRGTALAGESIGWPCLRDSLPRGRSAIQNLLADVGATPRPATTRRSRRCRSAR